MKVVNKPVQNTPLLWNSKFSNAAKPFPLNISFALELANKSSTASTTDTSPPGGQSHLMFIINPF